MKQQLTHGEAAQLLRNAEIGEVTTFSFGPGHLALEGDQSKLEEIRDDKLLDEHRNFDIGPSR